MGKITIIATMVFLYLIADAITLGAFNKPLPFSVISLVKKKSDTPIDLRNSATSLEKNVTRTDVSKATNTVSNLFNDATAVLGRFMPI